MTRTRERESGLGLLPRMEARVGKRSTTYRYHPVGGKPINLGHDRRSAMQAVMDMNRENSDRGTFNELWRLYSAEGSAAWMGLSEASRADYAQSSKQLLKRFGGMSPRAVRPQHVARYLRIERASAPVRANREFAVLSNLFNFAVERGELETNPCKQVRRNKERPRKNPPSPVVLAKFLEWAWAQKGQSPVLAGMAEFASLGGNRGVEFRLLTWPQVGASEIRIMRAKQRDGNEVVEVFPMHGAASSLMERMRSLAKNDRFGWVFPNSKGNCYTAQSFKLAWARLKTAARKAGVLEKNFTFHDLRSYYVTQYKAKFGNLPEIHADPGTTARIYDGSKVVNRKML